jgi:NADPH:quinone reductase
MRAFVLADFGASPRLTDVVVPEPEAGEVRVRVRAASVNGFDLAVAAGHTKDYMEHRFPLVLGKDFAGEVDAVGPGVTDYAVGDRVFGVVTKPFLRDGSFAEYVAVPTAVGLAKLPDSITFSDGAALGLVGAAANDLIEGADVQHGQTVLVVGATGGVGTELVQRLTATGAHVIATAHTDEEKRHVTSLGAETIVDHSDDVVAQTRAAAPDGVDVVFHLAGDTSTVQALRDGGRFVSLLLGSPDQVQTDTAVVVPVYANPTPETLDKVAVSHASGDTNVTVQQVFPLEETAAAFAAFAAGTLGKIVVTTD